MARKSCVYGLQQLPSRHQHSAFDVTDDRRIVLMSSEFHQKTTFATALRSLNHREQATITA